MSERTPQGGEWALVIDALHALTNTMTVRSHYTEGHPAIARADDLAETSLTRILVAVPQVLVAFKDDEFVICERPLPDLRERLHVLASAMKRHDIECIVFRRGVTRAECEVLGRMLPQPAEVAGRIRDQAQAKLMHVLLRSLEVRDDGATKKSGGFDMTSLLPAVRTLLADVTLALHGEVEIDQLAVRATASRILAACSGRSYLLQPRASVDGKDDAAAHALNVALTTAAMALESSLPETHCVEVTSAALLHDIGHVLLPRALQGIPEPLLDASARPIFKTHTTEGALALMGAGCPDLWIATALEHHRGVDGLGYPTLASKEPPHELVRMVALASFLDRKRTRIPGAAVDHDEALRLALALEDRYFGKPIVSRCVRALGAYPPGMTVELTNRTPAMVTQVNTGDAWRPQVQLLRGPDTGTRVELRELNASEGRFELSIARAIMPPLMVLGDVPAHAGAVPPTTETATALVSRAQTPAPGTPANLPRVATLDAIVAEVLEPPEEAVVTVRPIPSPNVTTSKPPPTSASTSQPPSTATKPPGSDELQAKLLEFLTDPPPALSTSKPPQRIPGAGAYSTSPPSIGEVAPAPTRAGSYSSVPAAGSRPPAASASTPPAPSSRMPVAPPARSTMPPATSVPVVVASPAVIARQQGLDHRAGYILSLIDGAASVEEITDVSGLATADVRRFIDELVARGLVAIKEV